MDRLLPFVEPYLIKDVARLIITHVVHNPPTPYEIGLYGIMEMMPIIILEEDIVCDYALGAAESNESKWMVHSNIGWNEYHDEILEGACRGNHKELIERMILMGANTHYGLRGACYGGHRDLIDRFLKLTDYYQSGLEGACLAGRKDVALQMIELGAAPNKSIDYVLENRGMARWLMDEYKVKPSDIYSIVKFGYIEFITSEMSDKIKKEAMKHAFEYNQTEIVLKLTEMGIRVKSDYAYNAFRHRNATLISLLPNRKSCKKSELVWACRYGNIQKVMELISIKCSSDIIMEEACNVNSVELMRIAIAHGHISDRVDVSHAGLYDNIDLLSLIPGNILKERMSTIFAFACAMNHRRVIDFLLDKGANPDDGMCDAYNFSNKDILQYLISKGAKPNSVTAKDGDITELKWFIYDENLLNYLFDVGMSLGYFYIELISNAKNRSYAKLFIDLILKRGFDISIILYDNCIKSRKFESESYPEPVDLEYLLNKGADPYYALALYDIDEQKIDLLIKHGVQPQHLIEHSVSNFSYYRKLIDTGVSPDVFVQTTIQKRDMEAAEYLLKKGASPRLYKTSISLLLIALRNGIVSPDYALHVACSEINNAWLRDEPLRDVIKEAISLGALNYASYNIDT